MNVEELLEVILEKNIFLVDVSINKANSSLVERVPQSRADDLDHGGDTGSARNHTDMVREVRSILEVALGALDTNVITEFEEGEVTGNVALLISLCGLC